MEPEQRWQVVCFGGVDFGSYHQRAQRLMAALAGRGADVVYVDNLGVRLPRVRDLPRVKDRLANAVRNRRPRAAEGVPGVRVLSSIVPGGAPALAGPGAALLTRSLRSWRRVDRPLVVWTYIPAALVHHVSARLGADRLVYDWCDDAAAHVQAGSASLRRRIARDEDAMASAADVVFVASRALADRRNPPPARTSRIEHGGLPRSGVPDADVAALPGPRIVLLGGITQWTDVDLLACVAAERPAWSLVLVGPIRRRIDGLAARPNVHLLGTRTGAAAAAVLEACDVGIIPYIRSVAIDAASPIKLRDYRASGLPVVSVDIPDVDVSSDDAVTTVTDHGAFLRALDIAVARGRTPATESRTWDRVLDEMIVRIRR